MILFEICSTFLTIKSHYHSLYLFINKQQNSTVDIYSFGINDTKLIFFFKQFLTISKLNKYLMQHIIKFLTIYIYIYIIQYTRYINRLWQDIITCPNALIFQDFGYDGYFMLHFFKFLNEQKLYLNFSKNYHFQTWNIIPSMLTKVNNIDEFGQEMYSFVILLCISNNWCQNI